VDTRGVSDEQMAAIGGQPRALGDILREVAEGAAEFTFVG
jgi:hypothetical protein